MDTKGNLIITPDNLALFSQSLRLLDASIKELLRAANNMVPETLVARGLNEALSDYCRDTTSKTLSVEFHSFGLDRRIEASAELIVYRIVLELIDIIVNHSSATEVLVQLVKGNERLNVLVENNGAEPGELLQEKLRVAILSKIDYLKGTFNIHSEKGKGTAVTIELIL